MRPRIDFHYIKNFYSARCTKILYVYIFTIIMMSVFTLRMRQLDQVNRLTS